ncbi:MAG: hypothetical protein ACE5HL_02810 [Terriglobia bacterium]
MLRSEKATVSLFITGLVALGFITAPLMRPQEAEPSTAEAKQAEREAMFYRYGEWVWLHLIRWFHPAPLDGRRLELLVR